MSSHTIVKKITDPTRPGHTTYHAMLLVDGRLVVSKFCDTLEEATALVKVEEQA